MDNVLHDLPLLIDDSDDFEDLQAHGVLCGVRVLWEPGMQQSEHKLKIKQQSGSHVGK
jgi:hypothetical protein